MLENITFKESAQTYSEMGKNYDGAKITAHLEGTVLGTVGYVEWNEGKFHDNDEETGRLKIAGDIFDIRVQEKEHRKAGIGAELIRETLKNMQQNGYTQLLIYGAIQSAKSFYDRTFSKLEKEGAIRSFISKERRLHEEPDYFYDVKISYP